MMTELEPHRYTMFPAEVDLLLDLIERHDPACLVEIGAYEGDVTRELLAYTHCDIHVIDPWDGTQDASDEHTYQTFLAATQPWAYKLTVHRQRSQEAIPPDGMDLVIHDGDHRQPDFRKWYDALPPGGLLIVHDYHEPGWPLVREACEALGPPWHSYRYHDPARVAEYGPSTRGLFWKVKT